MFFVTNRLHWRWAAAALFCLGSSPQGVLADAGTEVTLAQLLDFAERHAPQIRVARVTTHRAAAAADPPIMDENPFIEGSAGPRFGSEETGFDFSISLEQRLSIGQRSARVELVRASGRRLEEELGAARLEVRRRTAHAYYQAIAAQDALRVEQGGLELTQDMVRIIRRRLEAGDANAIEVQLGEIELGEAQDAVSLAEAAWTEARFELCFITGWSVETPPSPAGEIAIRPNMPDDPGRIEDDPLMRTQRAAIAEERARVDLEDRAAWPDFLLGIAFEREAADHDAEHIVLGTLGIELPLWNRNQPGRAVARTELSIAQETADAREFELRARAASRLAALRAEESRLAQFRANVLPNAESALELLNRSFDAGEISLLDWIAARSRLVAVQRHGNAIARDYAYALVEYQNLAGGQFQ